MVPLFALACTAVAVAFLKGLRVERVCTNGYPRYLVVSSRSWQVVLALCLTKKDSFRSFVLAGGACTLPDQDGFVSFLVVSLWLAV